MKEIEAVDGPVPGSPGFGNNTIVHSCNEGVIKALEAERDRFREEANRFRLELDKLSRLSCPICGSDVNGTNWKAKAEALAKVHRKAVEYYAFPSAHNRANLKKVLLAYQEEKA